MQVRVSIGILAPRIVVNETGRAHNLGILAPGHYAKGNLMLQPLGGAAELTALGVVTAIESLSAEKFHKNKERRIDARFVVDDSRLEEAFALFAKRDRDLSDVDPGRELFDELSGFELPANDKLPGIPPVITAEEADSIGFRFRETVRQKFKDDAGTSILAADGPPSRRLFHQFDLHASESIVEKLRSWPAIRFLDDEEVASTEGGAHKGVSKEGITIADNFIS